MTWKEIIRKVLSTLQKTKLKSGLKTKKSKKLKINDLIEELLLFPLYNTTIQKTKPCFDKGIYVEQKEIGLIGSYEIKLDSFDIDNVQFNLLQYNDKQLLQQPTYQNKNFHFRKKETLLIYQNSFEIL
jgi:hypothetical protein